MAISTGTLQMKRRHAAFGVEVSGVDLRRRAHCVIAC
jgi:hypothetical protein